MARALLGLLVIGMFTLTGYYAAATVGHPDQAPTLDWTAKSPCCHGASRCCSESGDCTGKCGHEKEESSCCEGKKECCHDKKDETAKKE